jgi:hypothetical protein
LLTSRSICHADAPARHLAAGLELLGHAHRFVDRHRERDAHVAAGAAVDLRVDADDFAAHVDQRAARIARIDGDVGLDQRQQVVGLARLGRDDAGGDGVLEVERRTDRDHPFAGANRFESPMFTRGRLRAFDLQQPTSVCTSAPITLALNSRLSVSVT